MRRSCRCNMRRDTRVRCNMRRNTRVGCNMRRDTRVRCNMSWDRRCMGSYDDPLLRNRVNGNGSRSRDRPFVGSMENPPFAIRDSC